MATTIGRLVKGKLVQNARGYWVEVGSKEQSFEIVQPEPLSEMKRYVKWMFAQGYLMDAEPYFRKDRRAVPRARILTDPWGTPRMRLYEYLDAR